ncbi:hypothetical protein H2202_003793 [Exophiala xenobiotica]|nr:hypothetical protein H2202_003793 [Exophiala xenobiotica]
MIGSSPQPPIVLFDYQFAPNAQRARNLLWVCDIPYQSCEQPFRMPRPDLADLGITHRRIPVNAIGRDVYADNRAFIEAVQSIFPEKTSVLSKSPADQAYEAFGQRTFWVTLPLVPVPFLTKDFLEDREELFSCFNRPDYEQLRPSALAEFRQMLDIVENDFLAQGPWIGGNKCGVADINASWMIKMVLQTLEVEKEPGFGAADLPKVHAWINGFPRHSADNAPEQISGGDAKRKLLDADYAAVEIGIDPLDPTRLTIGTAVTVEPNDE